MDNLSEIRDQFPITRQMIYLDAACTVPPPEKVMKAVTSFFQDMHKKGEDRQFLEEKSEQALKKFAKLINATAEEVLFIKNTTEGLNIAANGLPLKPGDNVIITDLEHLNNVYPWINLQERKGIEVRILKSHNERLYLDDLKILVDERTRALSVSFVTFAGLKIDFKQFGQFCRSHDIYFIVDGIQGVGRLGLDVKNANIDIMSCGGHKGLMAGRGTGCLYIDKRILDTVEVTYAGPPIELRHDLVGTQVKRSDGAKKFNAGGANYVGICALHAGLDFLDEVGISEIEQYDLKLGNLLIENLKEIEGVKILLPCRPEESSGIVSFTTPDNQMVAEGLEASKIRVAIRGSSIRVSPHFYNTEEEIFRSVEVVAKLLGQ